MRGVDQHLSTEEIEQLTGPEAGVPAGALEEAMRHLDSCNHCRVQVLLSQWNEGESLRAGDDPPSPQSGNSICPEPARWPELAAGIMPQKERDEYLEHAALCENCGPLLQAALEDVGMDLTAEEEEKVESLDSAQPGWQENLLTRITGKADATPQPESKQVKSARSFAFWPRWVLASAATALAAAGGWWGWILLRTPSVETLLAQAYTERRTIEVRIPGAKYAPMRVERGTGGSNLDEPPALLKAEALIGENLTNHPNDPAWLQAKGRADLLEGNYESAVQTLQRLSEVKPDSPAVLADLGSAYLERAEAKGSTSDNEIAMQCLEKALAISPEDPVIVFNHAIASEKLSLYEQAIADWEHYLRIDPAGGWSSEAQENLQRVKQRISEKEKRAAVGIAEHEK